MIKSILLLFVIQILVSKFSFANNSEDTLVYSNFCDLVTEAMPISIDVKIQHEYIIKHMDKRVGNKDIKDAYDVVFQVAPDKRYHVFKDSIEEGIGSKWKCDGLKEYFEQYLK